LLYEPALRLPAKPRIFNLFSNLLACLKIGFNIPYRMIQGIVRGLSNTSR
jgi:hypothetical protein